MSEQQSGSAPAKFLTGDLMRHVTVMALSASIGLLSMFIVDFVDLYFISLLGDSSQTAAVGFAGTLIFFNMSLGIGLMIAMSALAAHRIGQGNPESARSIATSVLLVALIVGVSTSALFFAFAPQLMALIGADGVAADRGTNYLRIVSASAPIMMIGMVCSGLLRAHGDARRAMMATFSAGVVNAVLDPIFIFALGLELEGAAIASVFARCAMAATAIYPVIKIYGGFAPFNAEKFRSHLQPIFGIAAPAILTNVATPIGTLIVTRFVSAYGDEAVAGLAVMARLTPLAFCVIFALSGAVGPIVGQNFGAGLYDRVRETLRKALMFTAGYTLLIWVVLLLGRDFLVMAFSLDGAGVDILTTFVWGVAPLFFFNGVLFISNAAFNNLNRPTWSTALNWGKNTIGVVPFVMIGADMAGAPGVLIGQALGGVFFALTGVWLAFRLASRYEAGTVKAPNEAKPVYAAARR
ncbi:MAG: MATE family efflux transporter [Pseudomonadota bacterium]